MAISSFQAEIAYHFYLVFFQICKFWCYDSKYILITFSLFRHLDIQNNLNCFNITFYKIFKAAYILYNFFCNPTSLKFYFDFLYNRAA